MVLSNSEKKDLRDAYELNHEAAELFRDLLHDAEIEKMYGVLEGLMKLYDSRRLIDRVEQGRSSEQ